MTQAEKIEMVQALVSDSEASDTLVSTYLILAEQTIIVKLGSQILPAKYELLQCKLAARYFLRRGAEGETSHNENGIGRVYGSADDADLLRELVPYVGFPHANT